MKTLIVTNAEQAKQYIETEFFYPEVFVVAEDVIEVAWNKADDTNYLNFLIEFNAIELNMPEFPEVVG